MPHFYTLPSPPHLCTLLSCPPPMQCRAEVSLLHRLHHPYVIDFIGVVLQPLCFILEWAPNGSLHSILTKYRKMDGRVSPKALLKTAYQVSKGASRDLVTLLSGPPQSGDLCTVNSPNLDWTLETWPPCHFKKKVPHSTNLPL